MDTTRPMMQHCSHANALRSCTSVIHVAKPHLASHKASSRSLVVPAAATGRPRGRPKRTTTSTDGETMDEIVKQGRASAAAMLDDAADEGPSTAGGATSTLEDMDEDVSRQRGTFSYGDTAAGSSASDVVDEEQQERQSLYDDMMLSRAFGGAEDDEPSTTNAPSTTGREEMEGPHIPPHLVPKNRRELERLLNEMCWNSEWETHWERKAVEDMAWASHHRQMEQTVNRFAPVKRLAAIMGDVEREDHESGNSITMHWPSWARAELRFEPEFDAFNRMVANNMDKIVWKPPPGAEDDEEMDIMDDVLLLTDVIKEEENEDGEGDSSSGGVLGSGSSSRKQARSLDALLEGTLPGVTSDWAAGDGFARDILGDEEEASDSEEE